jgi:hypothetical protein
MYMHMMYLRQKNIAVFYLGITVDELALSYTECQERHWRHCHVSIP